MSDDPLPAPRLNTTAAGVVAFGPDPELLLSLVQTALEEVAQVQAELEDRFGDPPQPVWNLLALMRLRINCVSAGVASVTSTQAIVGLPAISSLSFSIGVSTACPLPFSWTMTLTAILPPRPSDPDAARRKGSRRALGTIDDSRRRLRSGCRGDGRERRR